ncbi:MAG: pyridoxamine 5'-phosphate oxidase family protein [Omnitrophica bacterium]|nr:pyridoxamine 5'-phosphate oxidase family protein [Candidatus Omnitrophota bacterium]
MQNEELKKKILKVIKEYPVASMATIRDSKPWVRYMAMQLHEGVSLYSTSFAASRKIGQIKENNNVHAAFGADPKNWMLPYVNVEGTAEILTDPDTKKKCWHEMLAQFFKGPEDPNYVVIKITPRMMEYWEHGAGAPEVYREK